MFLGIDNHELSLTQAEWPLKCQENYEFLW